MTKKLLTVTRKSLVKFLLIITAAGYGQVQVGDSVELGTGSGLEGNYIYVMTKPKTFAPMPARLGPGYSGGRYAVEEVSDGTIVFRIRKQKIMAVLREGLQSGEIRIISRPAPGQ